MQDLFRLAKQDAGESEEVLSLAEEVHGRLSVPAPPFSVPIPVEVPVGGWSQPNPTHRDV